MPIHLMRNSGLTTSDTQLFKDYDRLLSKYMRNTENGVGLDLTLVRLFTHKLKTFFHLAIQKDAALAMPKHMSDKLESTDKGKEQLLTCIALSSKADCPAYFILHAVSIS